MVYDTYNYSLGVYKPTYNWAAPHCKVVGSGLAMFKVVLKPSQPIGDHPLWPCPLRVVRKFVRHGSMLDVLDMVT